MANVDDSADRVHLPTARRLEMARREGKVARSSDLTTAVVLLSGLAAIYLTTLLVWLRDHSPDQGRTLAHLDKSLRRAERLAMALSLAPRGPRQDAEETIS